MKKNIKFSIILSATLAAASFNAHAVFNMNSIGDDGNPNSVGNAGAKAKNVQTMLKINNQTDEKIVRLVIVNKANKQLYAAQLACEINKACTLNLGKITFAEDVILKFYDAKNQMVSAYNYMGKLDRSDMITIDDKWLGIYVFNKLKQTSQMSPDVLNNELTYFFQNYSSPDGTPDIFEELGLYFLAQNGGANEGKFYTEFLKKLEQDKVLGAKIISPTIVKSTLVKSSFFEVSSDSLMCNKIAKGIATWTKMVTGLIPGMGTISTVLGFASQTSNTLCAGDNSVNQRFDQINNELNRLNSELVVLGYDLKTLSQRLDQEVARLYLYNMEDRYKDMSNTYFMAYNGLNMPLVSFVSNTGGLSSSFKSNNNVRTLISSMQQQLNTFNNFVSKNNLNAFKNSLDHWCGDEKTMTGDIIQNRIQCNLMKNEVATYLYASAAQLQLMLGDEINTVIAAKKSGNIDNTWIVGNIAGNMANGFASKGWDHSVAYVNEYIGTRLDAAITTLIGKDGKDVYNPLKGFPEKLSDSIKAANCGYKTENGNVLPAVSQWVLNNQDNNAGPYIMSACHSEKEIINSRYYYKQRNSSAFDYDVVNVMGVLVPERFFSGGTGKNYGDINAFPWYDYTTLAAIYSNSNDNQLKAVFIAPKNIAVAGYGFDPEKMKQKYLAPNSDYTENFTRNGKAYTRKIFTPATSSNGNFALELSYYMADWWQIGPGEFFSFIRNTDETGVSYVWTIRSKINLPRVYGSHATMNYSERDLQIASQCMTNNCSIARGTDPKFNRLGVTSFKKPDGSTTIAWTSNAVLPIIVGGKSPELVMYVDGKPIYSK